MLLKKYISIFLFILGMLPIYSGAQSLRNFRSRSITNTTDTITLDSLSIVPGSLIITDSLGNQLNSEDYSVNYAESKIILKRKVSSLLVTYKVFPINFSTPYFHKDVKLIEPDDKGTYNPFAFTFEKQTVDIFKFDGLNKNGSISRGVSFGNSQDVVINSSFNLQLSGKLNNEIDILAAITDNNIPIQPDGNTQQIQDFDKVYIQLSAYNSKLIAGDFELTKPESYFMNFNKKAQGGSFTTSFLTADKKKKTDKIAIKTAAAISKGKYAKNTIPGIEGNQGPYKLTGAENETYIIVLSGTEKVFISGELMVRGQENDYVIDYNTAEITFTAKRLITKDSRISIEFEYSDKNYARSLFYSGVDYTTNKITSRIHFFTEQDLKNQAIQQELSDAEKTMLSQIGDSLSLAMVPYVDSIAYTNDQVLYKIKDTLVSGILYDSVYVYSTNPDSAHYRLGFSNVGANKGNYIQIQSSANGRVFQWVAPILGVKQGNYEPIIQLVTPKKKQLLTFSTAYAISKRTKTSVELALSNQDLNLFSSVGNSDNIGYAWKAQLSHIIPLTKKDSLGWSFITDISHEYANKQFNPIERYRSVEFERDWNLSTLLTNLTENSSTIKLSVSDKKKNYTSFQLKSFLAGAQYKGLQNLLNGNLEKNTVKLVFSGSLLSSDNTINNSRFIRSKVDLSKRFKKLIIGIKEEQEYNTFHKNNTDTLQLNSYSFQEMEGYISNADTTKNKFKLFYSKRMDYLPTNDELDLSTTAHNTGISLELAKNKNHTLTVYQTYRNLIINNTSLTTQKEDKSLISRLEYVLKAYKGALSSNTYYEIGSGQEVKKEYSYLEVVQGQGIYSWTDYNADGVKQLNEFEIAAFQDQANYIRIYIPTNQYVNICY